jgi:acyl-CoA synthetase (AMP-forming)/AMP-acid ligase II
MTPPSVHEVDAELTAPGAPFEITTIDIRGRPTRTWKHAPRHLGEILERSRELGGDRDFLVLGDERLTHRQHHDRVLSLASALVDDLGVAKGDRVAIAMRNLPEWSIAFFAAALAGAIATPLNAFWNGAELAFALGDCEPTVLVADGERLERLYGHRAAVAGVALVGTRLDDRKTTDPLLDGIIAFESLLDRPAARPDVAVAPDDPATIFYTSGTTSHPKGVLGTHRNMCANVVSLQFVGARGARRAGAALAVAPAPPPVVLLPVPLFHGTGCHANLVAQAWFGGTLVLMRRWDPESALELMEREQVTGLSAVPTMVWDLMHSPSIADRDLSALRTLGGGGSAAPPELLRRIQKLLPGRGSGTGYGLTESSSLTSSIGGPDYAARPTSVGVPVPICDVRIADDMGRPLPVGEVGEIWIAGPTVVPGYWRRPEETAATFSDGWLRSGDLGRLDEDGFLYIVDRAKDLVIRGGENVSSIEVEAALYEHPAVLEAAVFPVPHPSLGEEVGAVVRVDPGASVTADELRSHAASLLAPFKVPAHLWITEEPFPRGATGKIQKREIRAAYTATATAP